MVNFSSAISLLGSIILLHFAFLLDASSDQASALLSFKRSSIKIDPNNSLSSWGSGNPCSWSGVICSGEGNRVLSGLNLSNLGLIGRLSLDDLFSLRELQEINLRGNSFYGNLAAKMAISCAVESLDLSGNNFSGSVPASLGSCRSLRKLDLSRNQFSGEIPPELDGICSTLMELDLSGNKLAGGLPSGFSSCSSLEVLDLGDNQLSGDFIEETLHALPSLRRLRLAFNNISGDLPILSLKNNTQLEEIDFSANEFAGEILAGVCSAFPSLRKLKLQDNFISGKLPADLGTCKNLTSLDLSFNELAGEIPPAIWSLPELVDLAMWGNKLSGDVPDELCSKGDNLETLILNHNEISGAIPPSIGNCRRLVWLSLSGNKLAGKIPSAIGNLQNLAILQLGHNSLTGPIPSSIGRSRNLVWVDLSSNNLSGPIPSSMASSSGFVFPGAVTGKDFAFLRNVGDGSSCAGTGVIFEFTGIRPERLASFPLIHACPATRIYTGTAVYTFAGNGTMIYLDLSCNSLSGSIPEDMGSMIFLQVLNLEQNQLSGEIPDVFGELKSIGVLDLSHNRLSGSIPGALGSLSFLVDLDVSNNYLSGEIPPAGQLQTFNPSKFANNSALCGVPLPPCSRRSSGDRSASNPSSGISIAGILIGVAISVLVLLVALVLAFQKLGKKKAILGKHEDSEIFHLPDSGVAEPLGINAAIFEKPLRRLTFAQLMEGTNGFSQETLIGSGGFGEVYKATLDDGGIVAVKKLVHVTDQGDREFIAEMETLGKIKHRNLVPLLGYCKIRDERLLVYDYMKHGSLETILHGATMKLDWPARKKIAVGSARGLAFLHHSCIPHIIHRDMKSSNVLLDADLEARVSDFGMARLVSAVDSHLSVSTLAGTPGYVPPEYYQSFRCTTKGDVYSYGVLLLELLSGRRPIDQKEFGESDNLAEWAKRMVEENRREEIFDPQLRGDSAAEKELEQYLKIACWCLDERPLRRPTMIQVMAMFKEQTVDGDNETLDGFYIGL